VRAWSDPPVSPADEDVVEASLVLPMRPAEGRWSTDARAPLERRVIIAGARLDPSIGEEQDEHGGDGVPLGGQHLRVGSLAEPPAFQLRLAGRHPVRQALVVGQAADELQDERYVVYGGRADGEAGPYKALGERDLPTSASLSNP